MRGHRESSSDGSVRDSAFERSRGAGCSAPARRAVAVGRATRRRCVLHGLDWLGVRAYDPDAFVKYGRRGWAARGRKAGRCAWRRRMTGGADRLDALRQEVREFVAAAGVPARCDS